MPDSSLILPILYAFPSMGYIFPIFFLMFFAGLVMALLRR